MRLEFIFFIGIACNILLAMIFPYQFLPSTTAQNLISESDIGYIINDNTFGTNSKISTNNLYNTLNNDSQTRSLTEIESTEVSFFDTVSNFFDGLFDGLNKIKTYFLLLLPFGTIIGLLPGAIGEALKLLYIAIASFAIIKFIRSG